MTTLLPQGEPAIARLCASTGVSRAGYDRSNLIWWRMSLSENRFPLFRDMRWVADIT